ncbi:MAG: VOC family protein, partial [Chloroflexota bacterium]
MTFPIQATNAFYYYADLERAWQFYTNILGLETAADYGFAKILKLAQASYLTLVDAEKGMHSVDEPKTTTIAFVTDQVADWYTYLQEAGVVIERPFTIKEGSGHDGFVALDPEGYFLEFEVFNPHAENEILLPALSSVPHIFSASGKRPAHLGVQATVQWLYYDDIPAVQAFYEALFGVTMIADQGWAKIYRFSESGLIGLVDGRRGLHKVTEQKCVTVSFFTNDVESWFNKAKGIPNIRMRSEEVEEEYGRVRLFV